MNWVHFYVWIWINWFQLINYYNNDKPVPNNSKQNGLTDAFAVKVIKMNAFTWYRSVIKYCNIWKKKPIHKDKWYQTTGNWNIVGLFVYCVESIYLLLTCQPRASFHVESCWSVRLYSYIKMYRDKIVYNVQC